MRSFLWLTSALALCGFATTMQARAQTFDGVVVFGDSLSDGGNLADLFSLPPSRFTTNPGLTAVEYLAAEYGLALEPSRLGGTNYAYGGAGFQVFSVPDLTSQAQSYLSATPQISGRTLFFVWGGANDVFAQGVQSPDVARPALIAAAQTEAALLDLLQEAGAAHIVVLNLPDIGLTVDGTLNDTALVNIYNAELDAQLVGRNGIIPVNAFALIREIAADPAAFGYSNITDRACTTFSSLLCTPETLAEPNADQTYLFADDVHPTSVTHQALAQVIASEIRAPGQMSMLSAAPMALLRAHRASVAKQFTQPDTPQSLFLDIASVERDFDQVDAVAASKSNDARITFGGVWSAQNHDFALGGALSLGDSDLRIAQASAAVQARTTFISVFARARFADDIWVLGQVGYGITDYNDIERTFGFGQVTRTERADTSGENMSSELSAGWRFEIDALQLGPFAAISHDRVEVDGFAERGGSATAMRYAAHEREATIARLGFDLAGDLGLHGAMLHPDIRLAYAHDFEGEAVAVRAGLTTMNGEFELPGFAAPEDWIELSLGLGLSLPSGLSVRLTYEGAWSDTITDTGAAARVAVHF